MSNNYFNDITNANFIPEIVANQALGALGGYLNLGRTVARDTELTPQRVGDIIHVPKRGTLSANSKQRGNPVTRQNPTADVVNVPLDEHWEVTFGEEDFAASVQQGDVVPGYITDAVIVLGEKIETSLATLATSLTHSLTAGAGSNTPFEDFIDVRADLVGRKVPQLAPRYAYVHPDFVAQLLREASVLDPKVGTTERALTQGAISRVAGFDVFEGQLVVSDGSPAKKQNIFYLRNAFVLATRPLRAIDGSLGAQSATLQDENGIALRVIRSYNPDELAIQITLDVLFGTAVLDDRLATVLESA